MKNALCAEHHLQQVCWQVFVLLACSKLGWQGTLT